MYTNAQVPLIYKHALTIIHRVTVLLCTKHAQSSVKMTLCSTAVTPGFEFEEVVLADSAKIIAEFPLQKH